MTQSHENGEQGAQELSLERRAENFHYLDPENPAELTQIKAEAAGLIAELEPENPEDAADIRKVLQSYATALENSSAGEDYAEDIAELRLLAGEAE